MSTIDMTQVAGLQAVNEEGQVIGTLSVDDLTELVATKIVQEAKNEAVSARSASVMSEASTLAATDEYEDQLALDTNPAYIRSLDTNGNPKRTAIASLASVVGGLLPEATISNTGLMSSRQYKKNGRRLNKRGYIKLAESENWYTHYSSIISASSPMSSNGSLYAIDWRGGSLLKAPIINGDASIKFYIGKNGDIHELWIGLLGTDGIVEELATNGGCFSQELTAVDTLPSYLTEALG